MKTMGCLVSLFLLMSGCGPLEATRTVWTSDTREATLSQSESMGLYFREYTFDISTRKLSGHWIDRQPSGTFTLDDDVLLSEDQAAHLVERLERVRPDTTKPEDCWTDMPGLSLELVESSGESRRFQTDPKTGNCAPSISFVVKEDLLGVLDVCAALLPEPPH